MHPPCYRRRVGYDMSHARGEVKLYASCLAVGLMALSYGCGDEPAPASTTTSSTTTGGSTTTTMATTGGGGAGGDETANGGAGGKAEEPQTAAHWIETHFADAPKLTGDFDERTQVEAPHLVIDATGTSAKYAFDLEEQEAPPSGEVGFVRVSIADLLSADPYGAGIVTGDPGMVLYLAEVTIEPGWPTWESYATTNKDGIVLDGAQAFYAEDLTIRSVHADSAIDNKAMISQMARLVVEGPVHRSIRYWNPGPHYLVESRIDNPGTAGDGTIIWMEDCSNTVLEIYDSTFDGSPTIPEERIDCGSGSRPTIHYRDDDPRKTGEMHPMFTAP